MAKSLDGLHPTLMRPRVEALLADPEAKAMGLYVVSAFRSVERQQELWDEALRKYGSAEKADDWVARPGTSNHGPKVLADDGQRYGIAVDLGVPTVVAVRGQWPSAVERDVNRIAERCGLRSPMAWEDWHFEPIANWAGHITIPTIEEASVAINKPAVKILPTATGNGYFVVAADGGVFTYGDAVFFGSAAGQSSAAIVDASLTPSGAGCWLLASDGGVFTLGDAQYLGSPNA